MSARGGHDGFLPKVQEEGVSGRPLLAIAMVAMVVVTVAILVADRLLRAETPRGAGPKTEAASPQIGIVEQTLIDSTRRGLDEREAQRASLERLGWVDRARGIARIPIGRAMDLVADPDLAKRALAPYAGDATDGGSGEGM